ncbi:hypothetical protein [Amycolatopsis sp. Hca4]|nr:hypothetical protein [Amycolatopsis sp. Hca4]
MHPHDPFAHAVSRAAAAAAALDPLSSRRLAELTTGDGRAS